MMAAPSLTGTTENLQLRHCAFSAPSFVLEHYILFCQVDTTLVQKAKVQQSCFSFQGVWIKSTNRLEDDGPFSRDNQWIVGAKQHWPQGRVSSPNQSETKRVSFYVPQSNDKAFFFKNNTSSVSTTQFLSLSSDMQQKKDKFELLQFKLLKIATSIWWLDLESCKQRVDGFIEDSTPMHSR